MTLQEIIEWLKSIKEKYIHGGDEDFDKKRKNAIDIAISTLEKQIPKNPKTNFERIKAMNNEEMANFLMDWAFNFVAGKAPMNVYLWLESEVEEE